ncbi:MAG: hypothetical protein IEMM0008_0434 [bacterium]|nr:MAG: hypothetical protein IEMM0008_0434 [bacterium]
MFRSESHHSGYYKCVLRVNPVVLFILSLSILLGFCRSETQKPKASKSSIVPLEKRFNKSKEVYAFVIPNLKKVKGIPGNKAKICSKCHTEIYREWRQSTHAMALRDIQFQAELTKKDSPKWICLNCHIPVQNQRETVVIGLHGGDILRPVTKTNPLFDKEIQQEAITCAACHIRPDENGDSVIYGAFPIDKANSPPHPVKIEKDFLQNICMRCHNPVGKGLTRNLICWFQTNKELTASQDEVEKIFATKKSCVDCHMPEVLRRSVPSKKGLPIRKGHKHYWTGGGIPKWYDGYDQLMDRGYVRGLKVRIHKLLKSQSGSKATVKVTLTNTKAGHWLPTADPERFILMIAKVKDSSGQIIHEEKLRIGQEWKWSPARKISDNRIPQGKSIEWVFSIPLKSLTDGKLIITGYHVRVTSKNAGYHINAKGVDESLLKGGQNFVKNLIDHYPLASYIYKADIDLKSQKAKIYSMKELIELSKKEKGKPLSEREY